MIAGTFSFLICLKCSRAEARAQAQNLTAVLGPAA